MSAVRIVEVGPRDGLQNESATIPTEAKLRFIGRLTAAGIREIEAASFVSPRHVPQMADADPLWPLLPAGPSYWALVPNLRGLERAARVGVGQVAFFTAASEAFTLKNTGMTIEATLEAFVAMRAAHAGPMRAYVSTAIECPYAGKMEVKAVAKLSARLIELGADEISLGDTIGVAVPREVDSLLRTMADFVPLGRVACHFHDTRGTALANVAAALELGVRTFDASAGGLGGCPYAPGAGGNLATEDLVYFLDRSGLPTGVSLQDLARASLEVLEMAGRAPTARAQLAALAAASPR